VDTYSLKCIYGSTALNCSYVPPLPPASGRATVYVQSRCGETLHLTHAPVPHAPHGLLLPLSQTGLAPFSRWVGRSGSPSSAKSSLGRSIVL
jgi:hypothetical protein